MIKGQVRQAISNGDTTVSYAKLSAAAAKATSVNGSPGLVFSPARIRSLVKSAGGTRMVMESSGCKNPREMADQLTRTGIPAVPFKTYRTRNGG